MFKLNVLTLLIAICLSASALAAPTSEPALGFKKWKETQIMDAQNRVVRLSNSIELLKRGEHKETPKDPEEREQLIDEKKNELEIALQNLQFSKELSIEDYYAVYLSQYSDEEKSLEKIAGQMSQQEVAKLLSLFLRSQKLTQISNPGDSAPASEEASLEPERTDEKVSKAEDSAASVKN